MLRPWELQINIDQQCKKPVYLQIADAIISAIKTSKLKSGDALPGSRQLAGQLLLSRNTIVKALDVLLAEGWLVGKERKGAFVADHLPVAQTIKSSYVPVSHSVVQAKRPHIVFDDGLPDSRLAPMTELARAYRQLFNRKSRWQLMGYSSEFGDVEFRTAIMQMLNFKRGMRVSTEQICITRGSQMAMYLSAHCMLNKGDHIMVENPGYRPAWEVFESAGATLLPVDVDQEGLKIDQVRSYLDLHQNIRAIYTTPHHQFPTTVTMSLPRRLALVALSNEYGFTIIEDDYDHEFHFTRGPILPLASLENINNYIYIGTMSKIVAPALRTGYLVGSKGFIENAGALRKLIDVQGDSIMEQAILQLINEGVIKRHLKRASSHYKAKRDYFEQLILKHLSGKVRFERPEGGLAFWLVPTSQIDLILLAEQLLEKGVQILKPCIFSFDDCINGLRLGFASSTEEQLEEGVKAIAELMSSAD